MTQAMDIGQRGAAAGILPALRAKPAPKIEAEIVRQVKDLRKQAARQKLDFIEAQLDALELGGGNPKSRARALARMGRGISSAVREYKSLSPTADDAKNFARTADETLHKVKNVAKWHKTSLMQAGLPVLDAVTRQADLFLRVAARDIQMLGRLAISDKSILDVTV